MGTGGAVMGGAALPAPDDSRLEMVALSEYSGMTPKWAPLSLSSSVCVRSSSSSLPSST